MLLEPIMKLEVATPEDYFGDVLGDINRRRGHVQGMDQRGNTRVITATGAAGRDIRVLDRPALE